MNVDTSYLKFHFLNRPLETGVSQNENSAALLISQRRWHYQFSWHTNVNITWCIVIIKDIYYNELEIPWSKWLKVLYSLCPVSLLYPTCYAYWGSWYWSGHVILGQFCTKVHITLNWSISRTSPSPKRGQARTRHALVDSQSSLWASHFSASCFLYLLFCFPSQKVQNVSYNYSYLKYTLLDPD